MGAQHLVRYAGLKSGKRRAANPALAERISIQRRPIFFGWVTFQLGILTASQQQIARFAGQLLPSSGIYF